MAAAEQSIQQRIADVEADISEAKERLKAATGEERLTALDQRLAALEQRLAALEQQKLLLMQQQAGAAAPGSVASMESLRAPLLELVRQQKVTNTYLRNSATLQYKYTTSQATQHRDPQFKQSLLQAYGCQDPQHPDELFCMGLGWFVPKELVCDAHLFKYSWRQDADRVLGFTNINDPANGLLLIKPLEEAFDNGYLSITWRGTKGGARAEGDYCMHWLGRDDLLLHDFSKFPWKTNTKLSTEQQTQLRGLYNASGEPLKFADLHGKPLTFRTDKRPFRRCLVFQARYAMAQALAEGNITKPQLTEMAPYLASASPQAANIALYWQRMPDEGPDPLPEPGPVEDVVYDYAPESPSDAEDW